MAGTDSPRRSPQNPQSELLMLYEIGNAMRSTLRLDEILYIILTCVTAQEGLGFNRAMVFLVNQKNNLMEGRMGLGPDSGDDAQNIWRYIEKTNQTLNELLSAYKEFDRRTDSHLNNMVKSIRLPVTAVSGVLARTVLEKRPFEIVDKERKSEIAAKDPVVSLFNMEYFVTVPLLAKDHVVGVMLVDNLYSRHPITEDDIWMLTMFANQAGLAIENSQEFERALTLSNTDRLTDLWNYGYFQHQISEEIKRAARFNRYLSLLMVDIDHFKLFNDSKGHLAGDAALRQLADIFRQTCREVDLIARYGGEEFAIILPETHKDQAYASAERIRRGVAQHKFYLGSGARPQQVTISIGVSSFPQDADSKDSIISCADKALYAAKTMGRNRVCMYSKELS